MKFMPSMPSGSRFCDEEYLQMPLPNVVTASPAVFAALKLFGAAGAIIFRCIRSGCIRHTESFPVVNVRGEVEAAIELLLDELIRAHERANGAVVVEVGVVLELVLILKRGWWGVGGQIAESPVSGGFNFGLGVVRSPGCCTFPRWSTHSGWPRMSSAQCILRCHWRRTTTSRCPGAPRSTGKICCRSVGR